MTKDVLGYTIYRGPSVYDGSPIIVVVTGFVKGRNRKIGDMLQAWIMREDIAPHIAIQSGDDASVCGNCPLRPIHYKDYELPDPCYVDTSRPVLSVWNAYHRGRYQEIAPSEFRQLVNGKPVRLGAYGDPGAVPFEVWAGIGVGSGEFNHTSYTHSYLMPTWDERLATISMISADPVSDRLQSAPAGRTYRVIDRIDQVRPDEVLCPGSKEQNYRTTCADCGLCAGSIRKAKSIAIVSH